MKRRILALAYGGGHINIVLPVVALLRERGYDVTLLALTNARINAAASGQQFLTYSDFLPLIDQQRAREIGSQLAQENHNPASGMTFEESTVYLGVNYLELESRFGIDGAKALYRKAGRHAFFPSTFFEKILNHLGSDLVITTNSPKSERAAIYAAMRLGLKSVRIEDLFIDANLARYLAEKIGHETYREMINLEIHPSKICVFCEYAKGLYSFEKEALNITSPLEDIVVTGSPALEYQPNQGPLPGLIPARPDGFTVLWAHQPKSSVITDSEMVQNLIIEWASSLSDDVNFVAKFHPNSSESEIKEILTRLPTNAPNFRAIRSEVGAWEAIESSSVVLSQQSTMLAQAAYLEKPVIVLDPMGVNAACAYLDVGSATKASNCQELKDRIESLREENSALQIELKAGARRFGFKSSAVANIVHVVENLLQH